MLPWLESKVIGGNFTVLRDSVRVEMFQKPQNVLGSSRLAASFTQ